MTPKELEATLEKTKDPDSRKTLQLQISSMRTKSKAIVAAGQHQVMSLLAKEFDFDYYRYLAKKRGGKRK